MRRDLIAAAQVQRKEGRQLGREVRFVTDEVLPALRDKDAAKRPLVGDAIGQTEFALVVGTPGSRSPGLMVMLPLASAAGLLPAASTKPLWKVASVYV